jgi:ATP-dependent DNA helicase RecG
MLKESQNIEYKRTWKDEYLRHICAFANSRGGSLFIGVTDDGRFAGINDSKKLLEDIPNKAIHALGVYVEVVLHKADKLEYLEVKAQSNNVPISYKGVYYLRSGSTTQELKGVALQEFILKKMGRTFDDLFMPGTSIDDIDAKPVRRFLRRAVNANRITHESETDSLQNILSNLKLMNEIGELNHAGLLLFGKEPLRFFSSVSFRIGRFGDSDHDLRFQDVIEGNIFEMPDKVIETLRAKYLISPIRYEGLQRIEELEYPEEALREAVLNSIHPVRYC